jgi:hypothetical protein
MMKQGRPRKWTEVEKQQAIDCIKMARTQDQKVTNTAIAKELFSQVYVLILTFWFKGY